MNQSILSWNREKQYNISADRMPSIYSDSVIINKGYSSTIVYSFIHLWPSMAIYPLIQLDISKIEIGTARFDNESILFM